MKLTIAEGRENLTDRIQHQVAAIFKTTGALLEQSFKQLCPALRKVNWQAVKAGSLPSPPKYKHCKKLNQHV